MISLKSGLVSIVMPAYNAEKFIKKAIESILRQTYQIWELIVINDGSTDKTEEIINQFTDPRIRFFSQENSGESLARNHALSKIQGEFLAFLDADDFYHPYFLALMVSYLNQHIQKDAVYCDGYYVDSDDKILFSLSKFRRGPFDEDLFEQVVRASDVFGPPMTVMLRSEKVQLFDIKFDPRIVIGPDWDFFTHLSQFIRFGYLNQQLCYYRIHQNNITLTAGDTKKIRSLALCRRKMIDLPRFNECSEEVRIYVFYDLFVNLLPDALQIEKLMSHPSFKALSPYEQNRLIRLAIIKQMTLPFKVRYNFTNWLSQATTLCPNDRKTALIKMIYNFNPLILRLILNVRQLIRSEKLSDSPFLCK